MRTLILASLALVVVAIPTNAEPKGPNDSLYLITSHGGPPNLDDIYKYIGSPKGVRVREWPEAGRKISGKGKSPYVVIVDENRKIESDPFDLEEDALSSGKRGWYIPCPLVDNIELIVSRNGGKVPNPSLVKGELGIMCKTPNRNEAIVWSVVPGSSAAQAGFRRGDRIEAVNGKKVGYTELYAATRRLPANAVVTITYTRDQAQAKATTTLGSLMEIGTFTTCLGSAAFAPGPRRGETTEPSKVVAQLAKAEKAAADLRYAEAFAFMESANRHLITLQAPHADLQAKVKNAKRAMVIAFVNEALKRKRITLARAWFLEFEELVAGDPSAQGLKQRMRLQPN